MALLVTIQAPANTAGLSALAEGLAALSFVQMTAAARAGKPFPRLYESGIVYRREHNRERWQSAVEVLRRGEGDCEDLAAYLAAEYRMEGEPATVAILRTSRGSYHAVVRRGDGTIEDPSLELVELEKSRR